MKDCITRRKFMGQVAAGSVALTAVPPLVKTLHANGYHFGPRVRRPNPYVNSQGQPILVCVQGTDFATMLTTGLSVLGGLDLLIQNNMPVLIKPNLVADFESYPTISDPNSVVSMIQAIQQVSNGPVMVGDAGSYTSPEYYANTGFDPAIANAGGQLLTFQEVYNVRRSTWSSEIPDFQVYRDVLGAPLIIDFPNLKRHGEAHLSCTLKNHVGTVNGPDNGATRSYLHSLSTYPPMILTFLEGVAELAGLVNPELAVVDARRIMTVTGPYQAWGGIVTPCWKLILCGDIVAAEAYCSQIMDELDTTYDPQTFQPALQHAQELGLGQSDLSQVEIHEVAVSEAAPGNPGMAARLGLQQNYPNPFNQATTIRYELPAPAQIKLEVFDNAGRRVATLADGWQGSGVHQASFDGSRLASGNYVCKLETDRQSATAIKMVLLK